MSTNDDPQARRGLLDESAEVTPLRHGRARRGIALVALSVLLLGAAACGDDDDSSGSDSDDPVDTEDVLGPDDVAEGEPVRIGMVSDGSTDAFDNTDELRASVATADYWNAHRGGVAGRPLEVVTCETGADPAGGTDCANQMVQEDVVAVALSQSAVADSVWEPLNAAGIPTMFLQTSTEGLLDDPETSFTMLNPLSTLFGVPIAQAESEGTDTIAFVNIDVPQALATFESGAAGAVMDNVGLDYELIRIPPGTPDMTSQMQDIASGDAGVVYIVGNDAFCISAIQGLYAVGYDGAISGVAQCITDATREALPAEQLEGIEITASLALGDDDDPAYQLYEAVMATYGDDVEDVENALGMGSYAVTASLAIAMDGVEGDITPESVAEAIKAMPESEYPGASDISFQCGGEAFPEQPAVCTNQSLRAVLDADGVPASYEAIDSSDAVAGL